MNSFLDYLGHSGLKNKGLPPGGGSGGFQSPQDIVLGVPVVIGGDNLPFPVGIGLADLPNIGGASGPLGPHGSGITAV